MKMNNILVVLIVSMMMASPAFAVGEHVHDAVESQTDQSQRISLLDYITSGFGIPQAISADKGTYYPGTIAYFKIDATSWNVQCAKSKFVTEIYNPTGYERASYTWVGAISGNQYFVKQSQYSFAYDEDRFGTWSASTYLYCVDSSSNMYNKVISNAYKTTFKLAEKGKTCTAGYQGGEYCRDGDVYRNYYNTNCVVSYVKQKECGDSPCWAAICQTTDNDGDGVRNDYDLCPDIAGTQANNGCPIADQSRYNGNGGDDDTSGKNDEDQGIPVIALLLGSMFVLAGLYLIVRR